MPFIPHSFQFKIAISYVLIIIAMLLLLNIYPLVVSQRFVFQAKEDSLQAKAGMISATLSDLETLTQKDVSRLMAYLDDGGVSRIIVTDSTGMAVYDNSLMNNAEGRYILLPEIYYALSGSDVFYSRYKDSAFESKAASPVILRGAVTGAVYLYEYDTEQASLLRGIQGTLTNLSIGVCFLVLALSIMLPPVLTRRIGVLLGVIREMEHGNLSKRSPVRGRDELAELAEAFNSLADRLQKIEEMRRRLISDASHELKTPLASMRLLTDSILQSKDMDPGTRREFISDIGDEIDRLSRMAEKLLLLTRSDDGAPAEVKPVDLKLVVLRAVHMLEVLAAQSGVTLYCSLNDGCLTPANEDCLYQAVFNLMENGIKYNRPGGKVTALLYRKDGKVVLIIDDTGLGIPPEDQPRIFDRFYRVDKARSRERGGSGLGLSIVRANVESCGGSISLSSVPDHGSRFTVLLPAYEKPRYDDEKTDQ